MNTNETRSSFVVRSSFVAKHALILAWLMPCLLLLGGCNEGDQKLHETAAELFARTDGTDIVIAITSAMDDDQYRFVLNALNHRLGRPVTIYAGDKTARLLRAVGEQKTTNVVALPEGTIDRLTSQRNPLVAVRLPGSKVRFKILPIHPIHEFRREFLRTIEAEDLGGDFRAY